MGGGGEPTIVWYGAVPVTTGQLYVISDYVVLRAWSNGLLEGRGMNGATNNICSVPVSCGDWYTISAPGEGLAAASDVNEDGEVGFNDLLLVLADWGADTGFPVPPSDCPLALILP